MKINVVEEKCSYWFNCVKCQSINYYDKNVPEYYKCKCGKDYKMTHYIINTVEEVNNYKSKIQLGKRKGKIN